MVNDNERHPPSHATGDEAFHILEGELRFVVVGAGDVLLDPPTSLVPFEPLAPTAPRQGERASA